MDHQAFLHLLDCHWLARGLLSTESHFPKRAPPHDLDEVVVPYTDLLACQSEPLGLLMQDVLANPFLLKLGEIEQLHLLVKQLPALLLVFLLLNQLGVAPFYEKLGGLDLLLGLAADCYLSFLRFHFKYKW